MNDKLKKFLLAAIFISSLSTTLTHADELAIGSVSMGGTGCPSGSADVFIGPDQKELFIRFNQYAVEVDGVNAPLARKACSLAIPLHLPSGLSVSLMDFNLIGHISLTKKASAQISIESFLVGSSSPKISKTFAEKINSDFIISNTSEIKSEVWSKCGEDTILRVNTSLLAKSNKKIGSSKISIDGGALEGGVIYQIKTRSCE